MGELYWVGHVVNDATYMLVFAQFVLFSIILWRIPSILSLTVHSIFNGREDELYAYLQRYMPWPLFRLIVHAQTAIGLSLSVWLIAERYGLIKTNHTPGDLLIPLALFGIIIVFEFLRRLTYRFFNWLYSPAHSYDDWRNYASIAEWIWCIFLPVVPLLALSPISPSIALIVLISLFVVFRMSLIFKSIKLCRSTEANPLQVFLYLCTHEILPYLYLIVGVGGLLYL